MITLTATDTLVHVENRALGIIKYGDDNLYPNYSRIMAENSGGLKRCISIKDRFVYGKGVTENDGFWKARVNPAGLRVDQFVRYLINEWSVHNGFAIQIGYNGLLEKTHIQLFPYETCRLPIQDDEGGISHIQYCDDWSKKRLDKGDVVKYSLYTKDKDVIMSQIELAGGFDKWKGHLLYFGKHGQTVYPYSTFHSVLEDVITDIKLKKGKNANVSTNFLVSHILQLPFLFKDITPYPTDTDGSVFKAEFVESLQKFQGLENLGKLCMLENPSKDKDGNFVPYKFDKLDVQNFDKLYEYTEKSVADAIRQNYSQPEILHNAVATGFSTEILDSFYNLYNQITALDRQVIEETLMEVFSGWHTDINPSNNYSLQPLSAL